MTFAVEEKGSGSYQGNRKDVGHEVREKSGIELAGPFNWGGGGRKGQGKQDSDGRSSTLKKAGSAEAPRSTERRGEVGRSAGERQVFFARKAEVSLRMPVGRTGGMRSRG